MVIDGGYENLAKLHDKEGYNTEYGQDKRALFYMNPAQTIGENPIATYQFTLKEAIENCDAAENGCHGIAWSDTRGTPAGKSAVGFLTSEIEAANTWQQEFEAGSSGQKAWGIKQGLFQMNITSDANPTVQCDAFVDAVGQKCAGPYESGASPRVGQPRAFNFWAKKKPLEEVWINLAKLYEKEGYNTEYGQDKRALFYMNPAQTIGENPIATYQFTLKEATEKCKAAGDGCQGIAWSDTRGTPAGKSAVGFLTSEIEAANTWQQEFEAGSSGQKAWGIKQGLFQMNITSDANPKVQCDAFVDAVGQKCAGPYESGASPRVGQPRAFNFWAKGGYAVKSGNQTSGVWCLASITKIPKIVNGTVLYVEIKDLKVGDIVQTTRGNMPISDIMKTDTKGYIHDNYVRVEKDALGENFPAEDLYVTHEHSFSLGYYKNSLLNRNIHDNEQDDMVYLHITAGQLADKLSGVTRVSKEFESAINLVFDEHTSINVYGLDVVTHHPKGNPHTLPEEKYQDKSKFNNKVQKPLFASYDMLVNAKPEHMEMKDFLRGCITADLNNKLNLENVNNISFSPQKTMLTEDLRHKLKVV